VVDLGGDGTQVPSWDKAGRSYDGIYLVKITTRSGQSSVSFSVEYEGLDHLSTKFPSPASAVNAAP
jgi:hypothetical protein